MREPDFERLRTVLSRSGEPDFVPLGDIGVHPIIKARFLGRPIASLADEVAFWTSAGYDFVPIEQGLQLQDVVKRRSMRHVDAEYAVESAGTQNRGRANEGRGLITNWPEFEAFPWPDPDRFDYSDYVRVGELLPPRVKVVAVLGKVFSCVWWLMGLEGLSEALADDPALVAAVFDRVGRTQRRVLERMLEFPCVGAIWHADDVAYATQLMVNPRLLRAELFPRYRAMNELAHAAGRLAVYHSDGALQEVLDDVVASGFDALNPIEPKAMDIRAIKRDYGDRLAILGNVDLGYTLTRGTPAEVRAEVQALIRDLAPGGGYAVASSNSVPEYVPFANFQALREATLEYGGYPIQ